MKSGERDQSVEQRKRSVRTKSHARDIGSPYVHIARRHICQSIRRKMKVGMHKFLVLPIAGIMVRNQPGDTSVYFGWHIHMAQRINEGCPWNLLEEFGREVRNKGCKILQCLDRIEVAFRRSWSGVNSLYDPISLACADDGLSIGKALSSTNGLRPSITSTYIGCNYLGSESGFTFMSFSA
jgi:hypothetical protein